MNWALPWDSNEAIVTVRWYEAPPPPARGRVSSAHVDTEERVRSHTSGVWLDAVCPAASVTICVVGFAWQSVERHHTSLPLMIVNACTAVPTSIVQSRFVWLVSDNVNFGNSSAPYVVLSVDASTRTSCGPHATISASGASVGNSSTGTSGVACPEASALGDSEPVVPSAAAVADGDVLGDELPDCWGAGVAELHGCQISNAIPRITTSRPPNTTKRRRR